MRRRLAAIALVLSTAGWVCDSTDPCPSSQLACANDVAEERCCPQGSPYLCNDTCSATPQCSDYLVCKYPEDPGSGLCTAGAYQAAIAGITCTRPTASDAMYRTTVTGTLVGCGVTAALIKAESPEQGFVTANCGTWTSMSPSNVNATVECVPTATVPSGAQWQAQGSFFPPSSGTMVFELDVTITLGVAAAPVLASAMLSCPPYP